MSINFYIQFNLVTIDADSEDIDNEVNWRPWGENNIENLKEFREHGTILQEERVGLSNYIQLMDNFLCNFELFKVHISMHNRTEKMQNILVKYERRL